jgi:hypothetical protein
MDFEAKRSKPSTDSSDANSRITAATVPAHSITARPMSLLAQSTIKQNTETSFTFAEPSNPPLKQDSENSFFASNPSGRSALASKSAPTSASIPSSTTHSTTVSSQVWTPMSKGEKISTVTPKWSEPSFTGPSPTITTKEAMSEIMTMFGLF